MDNERGRYEPAWPIVPAANTYFIARPAPSSTAANTATD